MSASFANEIFDEVKREQVPPAVFENNIQLAPEIPAPQTIELQPIDMTSDYSSMALMNDNLDSDDKVLVNCSKLLRYLHQDNVFVFKAWNSGTKSFEIKLMKWSEMKAILSVIQLNYADVEKYTVWDCLVKHIDMFAIQGLEFSPENHENFFNQFRGWYYDSDGDVQFDIIKPFLKFVAEVIASGEKVVYSWLLSWVASIIQNVGGRTETAIILKGDEGVGKNFFTNCLAELFRGYSIANVADINLIAGKFNDIIRGKVLIVVNVCFLFFSFNFF
jgi:hypothetical protein